MSLYFLTIRTALHGAVILFAAFVVCKAHPASAQGITEVIAISGQSPPDGNGTFSTFSSAPVLNNAGQTAFVANLAGTSGGANDDSGIYRSEFSAGALTLILRERGRTPNSTGFNDLGAPALNAVGQLAFTVTRLQPANLGGADFLNIYRASGGQLTSIAEFGAAPPDGNGDFSSFYIDPSLNASGQVAFRAILTNTSGGSADNTGIYRGEASAGSLTLIAREKPQINLFNGLTNLGTPAMNSSGEVAFQGTLLSATSGSIDRIYRGSGGALTTIASEGDAAPDGNGNFSSFGDPALNALGQAAFFAALTGASGGLSEGIFLSSGGTVTQIARAGIAAPDGNGEFSSFFSPALNASGQAAFFAALTGTTDGLSDNTGIFLGSNGAVTQIARAGIAAPDGNGEFSSFSSPALNALGQVAFRATLTGTSGGTNDDEGLFLANGIDTIQIARKGGTLAGGTITDLFLASSVVSIGDERSGINDNGQVAHRATLSNGDHVIGRFTIPDVHWTADASGSWDAKTNWSDGIQPNSFYATFIDPASDVQVFGPSGLFHAESLTVGGGAGKATLSLQADSLLGILGGPLTVASGGTLTGSGIVDAPLFNQIGGQVRLAAGQTISFTGASNENTGRITLIGGTLHFDQDFANTLGGLVIGNGSLSATGGITNFSTMAFSSATSVVGDVTNSATGLVATAGGTTTFLDDVDNQGEVRTSAGSHTVFFGALTGAGSFTGPGTVVMENDFTPGASPAEVDFDGNVVFGPAAALEIEISGTTPGGQFDTLAIAGSAALAGTLDVSLLGAFAPSAGDQFEILTAANVAGTFDTEMLPDLGGLVWNISYGGTNVMLEVVSPFSADFDQDGDVDGDDLAQWQGDFGSNGLSDADADGDSDGADFLAWQQQFGSGTAPLATSHAVPEPASLWLLLALLAPWSHLRKVSCRFHFTAAYAPTLRVKEHGTR